MIEIPIIRKILTIGIILLFFGTWVIPVIAQQTDSESRLTTRGDCFYVGGGGPGNYSTIQDAINESRDGDTVFVYHDASPYNENVIINKAIFLQGEDKETTIIDSGSVTILIIADYVSICGFTITNSQWLYDVHRAGIYLLCNYTFIYDNIITYVWEGINCGWFNRSINNTTIEHNKIDFVKGQGILLVNTNFSSVSNNTINHTFSNGININNASEDYIMQNIIQNISDGHGIQVQDSNGCQIINNTIQNVEMDGISLTDSINTVILFNAISSIGESGIVSQEGFVNMTNNTVYSCDNYGIIASGDNYSIAGNIVLKNKVGIFLSDGKNCIIKSNVIKQNKYGLSLSGTPYTTVSQNNFIDNNNDANFTSLIATKIGVLITCVGTRFQDNYWGRTRYFPKIILGLIYFTKDGQNFTHFSIFRVDWHPAKEPYNI